MYEVRVQYIPHNWTELKLKSVLEELLGVTVENVRIKKNHSNSGDVCYGFVEFFRFDDLKKAVDESEKGKLDCTLLRESEKGKLKITPAVHNCCVKFYISQPVSVADVMFAFGKDNNISGVEFDDDEHSVYIEYNDHESAVDAVKNAKNLFGSTYKAVWDSQNTVIFGFMKEEATLNRDVFNENALKLHFSFDNLGSGSDIVRVDLPWNENGDYTGNGKVIYKAMPSGRRSSILARRLHNSRVKNIRITVYAHPNIFTPSNGNVSNISTNRSEVQPYSSCNNSNRNSGDNDFNSTGNSTNNGEQYNLPMQYNLPNLSTQPSSSSSPLSSPLPSSSYIRERWVFNPV